MSAAVKRTLDVLCSYYTDRAGSPRVLNVVQAAAYTDALAPFAPDALEAAAKTWIRQSAFFPSVSDLLKLLVPPVDLAAQAHLAWAAVEAAIRQGGVYRGAYFADGAIGEACRQTFGSWAAACAFDRDSPGWAIRRQTFLAIFQALAQRPCAPVLMGGLHPGATPHQVGAIAGRELSALSAAGDAPIGRAEAKALVQDVTEKMAARNLTLVRGEGR